MFINEKETLPVEETNPKILKLYEDYRKALPGRILEIESSINAYITTHDASLLMELRNHIHKLSGSAGLYGYPEISDLCKECEQKINIQLKEGGEEKMLITEEELRTFLRDLHHQFDVKG